MPARFDAALPVPTDPPPDAGVLRHLGVRGCVRLPIRVDAPRLAAELDCLPVEAWTGAYRGPVVFASVDSFLVVGYPRGATERPPDDQPVLMELPYLRQVIRDLVPASPTRGIVARLPNDCLIPIHTDTLRLFRRTVRLSVQVAADGPQRFFCDGLWYAMAPGEVWVVDNLVPHGINNIGARPRTSLIVDYLPSSELVALIADGDHDAGVPDDAAFRTLESLSRRHYRAHRVQQLRYGIVKLWRRRAALGLR